MKTGQGERVMGGGKGKGLNFKLQGDGGVQGDLEKKKEGEWTSAG